MSGLPQVDFMESFSSRLLHGRGRFATKSPGLPGPCSFLLNFPEGGRGDHLRKYSRWGRGSRSPSTEKRPRRNEGAEREDGREAGMRGLEGRDGFNQTSYNDFSL